MLSRRIKFKFYAQIHACMSLLLSAHSLFDGQILRTYTFNTHVSYFYTYVCMYIYYESKYFSAMNSTQMNNCDKIKVLIYIRQRHQIYL